MSKEENITAQQHLAENGNAGNIDAAARSFAPDAVDHDPAFGQPVGREGFRTSFSELTAAFLDARIEPAHMVADEDNVAVAYTLTGTHEGEFPGIAPTGKQIEIRGQRIGRFEHGQIVERWGSSDALGILQQLGGEPKAKSGVAKLAGKLGS